MDETVKYFFLSHDNFFENIIQSSNDAIISKNLDGIVLSWNPAAESLFGYSATEMIGHPLLAIIPPDHLKEEDIIIEQINLGKKILHFETERLRKNQERIHVSVTISPIFNEKGEIIGASKIARDITERKQTEKALALSEMRFEDLYNHAPCGYHSLGPDGVILNINHTELLWLGFEKEEVIGKMKFTDFLTGEGKDNFKKNFSQFIATGRIQDLEIELIGKTGQSRLVSISATAIKDSNGNMIKSRSVAHDITARKEAERQLRESEERLALASKHNGVGIWDWNLVSGKLVWDDSMFTLYHINRDHFSAAVDAWEKSLHPDDRERCAQELQATLLEDKPYETEFRIIWPDQQVRYIKAVAKLFYDKTDEPIRMLGINTDITEQRMLEEELKRQARIDYLTGVFNRGYFMERAEQEFSRSTRYGNDMSLLMMDVDFFKRINDQYGHKAGDYVLMTLAEISVATFREADSIGRLGGEEFGVLLKETGLDAAISVAERLRIIFADAEVSLEDNHFPVHFTVSIGLATLSKRDKSVNALLKRADKALYKAKNTGRNKVCIDL